MALKKGICKNFDNCTLAEKPEIQEVDSSEFRCAECGKELFEYKEPPPPFPLKLILIIVAVLLLIGGGVWAYFGLIKDRPEKEKESVSLSLNKEVISLYVGENDTLKATVSTQPSNAKVSVSFISDNPSVVNLSNDGVVKATGQGEASITVIAQMETGIADTALAKVIVNEKPKDPNTSGNKPPVPNPDTNYGTYNANWYKYNGPRRNDGKPADGIWGEMIVTKDYCIDMKDGRGGALVVKRGDVIVNPKFKDGEWMLQGELYRTDGTRRVL